MNINHPIKAAKIAAFTLLVMITLACTASPPTITSYAKEGVSFNHHSNWKVTEDTALPGAPGFRFINLEGPSDAIVMLTLMPSPPAQTLEEFASSIASERATAIKETGIGPIRPAKAGATTSQAISGRVGGKDQAGIAQKFSISLLGQQVPHDANFFMLPGEKTTAFIVTQVSSDSAKQVAPATNIILDSLRIGAPK